MVLNYIWIGFFLIAMVVAVIQFIFFNDVTVFERMVNSTFEMSEFSVMKIALPLAGVMILWLGLMNIGEKAGAVRFLSKIVGPFFGKLFPEIPKNHPVHGQLLMNFSANMLGLDNAATPLGLKAMNGLQELNKDKDTASNAQIMFLALNTSGLTLIPINIMAQRAILGAQDPTDIFIPLLMATFVSTLTAIIFVGIKQKLNLLNRVVIGWIGGIIIALSLLVYFLSQLDSETMSKTSKLIGNIILFSIIIGFIGGGLWKKINVYEAFIEGAKDGFKTSVTVMPYLVGMLVGIGVFRASGAMDLLTSGIEHLLSLISINTDFVNSLPTALMKPLSGSGAKAMMVETMNTYGADSFVGRLSCMFQGAADTTFYIIALYFGSVGIKKTRYAVTAGLVADLGGVIAAIFIGYIFFH
ncbi:MAG TPA: nucleoside recognition domain-containing protein [Paludibacteraceae bacterium]|nr:nucleoside recognition domain-containing protein [Paludibacteraceae bacterium]